MAGEFMTCALLAGRAAAGAADSQGLPAWVAGLFAIGGAAVTLLVQTISGHNAHRRLDTWSSFQCLADFLAAADTIIRTSQPDAAHGAATKPAATRQAAGAGSAPSADPAGQVVEAFARIETAYAMLTLAVPALTADLDPVRANLAAFAATGPRDDQACQNLRRELDLLVHTARSKIRFPILQVFGIQIGR